MNRFTSRMHLEGRRLNVRGDLQVSAAVGKGVNSGWSALKDKLRELGFRFEGDEPAEPAAGEVALPPEPSFVVGDRLSREEYEKHAFTELEARPVYGPVNLNGTRSVVGYIRPGATRADTADPLERLTAMLEYADAHMDREGQA